MKDLRREKVKHRRRRITKDFRGYTSSNSILVLGRLFDCSNLD